MLPGQRISCDANHGQTYVFVVDCSVTCRHLEVVRQMTLNWRLGLIASVLVIVGVALADVPPREPASTPRDDVFASMSADQIESSLLGSWNMHLDAPKLADYKVPADYVLTITSVKNGKVKASETPRLDYYIRDGEFDVATRTLTLWREYHGICIGCGIWKWTFTGKLIEPGRIEGSFEQTNVSGTWYATKPGVQASSGDGPGSSGASSDGPSGGVPPGTGGASSPGGAASTSPTTPPGEAKSCGEYLRNQKLQALRLVGRCRNQAANMASADLYIQRLERGEKVLERKDCLAPISVKTQTDAFLECARVYVCTAQAYSCAIALAPEEAGPEECGRYTRTCLETNPIPK